MLLELEGRRVGGAEGSGDAETRRKASREQDDATRRLRRDTLARAIAARSPEGAGESAAAAIADVVITELGGPEGGCVGWDAYVSAMMSRKTVHSAHRIETLWSTIQKRRVEAAAAAAQKQLAAARRCEPTARFSPRMLRLDTSLEGSDAAFFSTFTARPDTSPLHWHRLSAQDLAEHFLACDLLAPGGGSVEGGEEGGGARARCAAAMIARWGSNDMITCTEFVRACSEGVAEFAWCT